MPDDLTNQNSCPRSAAVGDFNNDGKVDVVVVSSATSSMTVFFGNSDGTFSGQTTYSTGTNSYPYSVAVGHFNGDNHLDIVVGNYGTHSITGFFGRGDGNFTLELTYSVGISRPRLILVYDVDNDAHSDLIVVNHATNTIGIISSCGNGTFSAQILYSMGYDSLPYSATVGDFNNDTRLDIAVASYGTHTVDILLGDQRGLFVRANSYFLGRNTGPCSIAVSDFNKDNRLDVVVANSENGSVDVLFGYGNGTFGSRSTFFTNVYGPQEVTTADINNDKLDDIVITDSLNDAICVVEGSDGGAFGRKLTYSTGVNSGPRAVIIADLNKDKRKDMVIVNNGTNNVAIMLGRSSVSFFSQKTYSDQLSSPSSVAVGDFNNDSRLDFVVANYEDDNVAVFLADNGGGYTLQGTYSTGFFSYPKAVAVADFNNDSQLDFVVAVFSNDLIRVYLGNGNGTFGNRQSYSTGSSSGPQFIAIGDLNNDHRLDIVIANYRAATVGIFLGIDNGRFSNQTTYTVGTDASPSAVALGDFNSDNCLDIVFSATSNDKVVIFFGLGNGSFIDPVIYTLDYGVGPYAVAVSDFNNDTKLDIAVTNRDAFNVGIFLGFGNGSFAAERQYLTEARSAPASIAIADLNNDQILDIVVGHSNTDYVGVFLGIGDGTFGEQSRFSTGDRSSPSMVAVGDMNNDDRLDLVVANSGANNIGVFIGYDDGGIVLSHTYSTGSATHPQSITTGDFNRDGELDIVIANYGTGTVSLLLGYGNISFTRPTNYETGSGSLPSSVVIGDFNNDSVLDIAVSNFGQGNVGLFLGHGNGTFAAQTTYFISTNSRSSALAAGDVNNDQQLDLVVAQAGNDSIGVLLGYRYPDAEPQEIFIKGNASYPCLVALADFNDDGLLDIVVINVTIGSIDIYLALHNGNFSYPINSTTGNGALLQAIAMSDFNNDHRLDIVAIDLDSTGMRVFLGYGNGTMAAPTTYSIRQPSVSKWFTVGDLNSDNRTDIVVPNSLKGSIEVFLAYSDGTLAVPVEYSGGDEFVPCSIAIGDFNHDDKPDIVVVNDFPEHRRLEIFLGYGNGSLINETAFSVPLVVSYTTADTIVVADFNNDKQLDIAVCYSAADLIGVFIANGTGSFAPEKTYLLETNSHPTSMAIGDLNNDNRLDIVVPLTFTHKVGVLLGFGDGTFQLVRLYSTGPTSEPWFIGVGDLNRDRILDIIVSTPSSGSIGIFFGFYREIFFRQLAYTTGSGSAPQSVAIGDFTNDTRQDIAVVNTGNDNIGVFIGSGDGTFQNQTIYQTGTGSRPHSVAVGDFNSDYQLDIVVTNYGQESIAAFLGYNNGTFASRITSSTGTGSRPSSITIFDFNGDHWLDVAVTDEGTNNVVILIGNGDGSFTILTKYATGFNTQPCAIAVGDFNNDSKTDLTVANCGTNKIGFISKIC